MNLFSINESVSGLKQPIISENPQITLSKNGQNVVILMLDRALGEYIPYFIQEKPELLEMYAGFTYYPNTVSFGVSTNFAVSSLFGGYEYTPYEMNKRDQELLVKKHNEAIRMLPIIFDNNGFDVTFYNPTYANYEWIPDVSIFDEYPRIKASNTTGAFVDWKKQVNITDLNNRNLIRYSIMKVFPLFMQEGLYDDGRYLHYLKVEDNEMDFSGQHTDGLFCASGIDYTFAENYTIINNLIKMTRVTEDRKTMTILTNKATHEPILLQAPDFIPMQFVDNTEYESMQKDKRIIDGIGLKMNSTEQYAHYYTNMGVLLQIGKWLDYLKEKELYDNTRIIIVSDHGFDVNQLDDMIYDDEGYGDLEMFRPLLMIKDFNKSAFEIDSDFMTNADVPYEALNGLVSNPINPFTGKELNNTNIKINGLYVFGSDTFSTYVNNGNTFLPGRWYKVERDVRNKDNWSLVKENTVLPE